MHKHRKILLAFTIVVHCVAFAIFALCLLSGPPMGESEFSPWDLGFWVSALLGFLVLPLLYLGILKGRTSQPSTPVTSSVGFFLVVAALSELVVLCKTFGS
jgi:hypothetical protein